MEENEYAKLHKYIDQLPMFLNWEADTVLYAIMGLFGGIEFNGVFRIIFFIGGISLAVFNEKVKNTKYKNYIKHLMYMIGLAKPKKRLPPSYMKYFIK